MTRARYRRVQCPGRQRQRGQGAGAGRHADGGAQHRPGLAVRAGLSGDDAEINKAVEAGKKQFVGFELPGRTLGVIGLGAIGVLVANAARALGMKVIGYDPSITVRSAWKLEADVEAALSVDDLVARSDFITFHVPLTDQTRHMINAERIQTMKDGAVLLNFSRNGIIDDDAAVTALDAGKLYAYVCDFPSNLLKDHPRVVTLPHLGASTREAEENCAVMVADQVRAYLEDGNVHNSVNFPEINLPRNGGYRMAVVNSNVPNMVGQISTDLAEVGLNIIDMLNRSRGDAGRDPDRRRQALPGGDGERIRAIDGVLSVRCSGREREPSRLSNGPIAAERPNRAGEDPESDQLSGEPDHDAR
jgi:D-3-phosphoglycerate dehydrogenase